ncbi:glycosyltransferase [Aestuariivivens sediminicola]|uniref:glycosyltransferase n=1 Tax=Aestuariivivens sediminicola TaxID=2913560 RepID=UPI001F5649D4|nr:glycosyltransferase [Aestuariivivens sediminicola]
MTNRIAVLLPHYNNRSGLHLTLESLLRESENFTVFIVDDGSTDVSEVIKTIEFFSNDLEIVLIENEQNLGIVKSLNKGLKHILDLKTYDFIARLDAGDKCLDNRFKQQKDVLERNKDIALVGSWVRFVDMERQKLFDFKPPVDPDKLRRAIHSYNPFVHPSVMYSVELVKNIGFYPEGYPALEDHAYFFSALKSFKAVIISKILLEYEINPEGISSRDRKSQTKSRIKLLWKEYRFGIYPTVGLLRAFITYLLSPRVLLKAKKLYFFK